MHSVSHYTYALAKLASIIAVGEVYAWFDIFPKLISVYFIISMQDM